MNQHGWVGMHHTRKGFSWQETQEQIVDGIGRK